MSKISKETIIIFFYCFCFMGCQADPSFKKTPRFKEQIVNRSVTNSYNPSVDILFIVDDSESMSSVQELLAKNTHLFMNQFLDVEFIDYHIGVTTSSITKKDPRSKPSYMDKKIFDRLFKTVYGGYLAECDDLARERKHHYSNYVERNTQEVDKCLGEMMNVGIIGNDLEHFFDIPALVLSGKMLIEKNFNFYRPEAHLAVFVITDADDQSGFTPKDSYEFLLSLKKGDERKIHYAAGIVAFQRPEYGCDRDRDRGSRRRSQGRDQDFPPKIMEMVKLFDHRGYWFNLCQFNYGKNLSEFASHLVDSVLAIPLNYLPNMGTIEVRYDYEGESQLIPNGLDGWTYDTESNAIHLSRDIQVGQMGGKFNIQYEWLYLPEF